jgi:hypothetical protein
LFGRWERVWHEGRFDLVPECVGPHYIRHDEAGDRTVTREAYATEIAKVQQDRPGIRVVVYDHSFQRFRAWFRFALKWTDTKTGEARSRAGMQSYRIEAGKLVRHGCRCSRQAVHGPIRHKSIGQARRIILDFGTAWTAKAVSDGVESLRY